MSDIFTLGEFFDDQCGIYLEKPALSFISSGRKKVILYSKLLSVAEKLKNGMVANGLRAGDRVIIASRNSPEWVLVYYALKLLGAVDIAVRPDISESRLRSLSKQYSASAIFAANERLLSHIKGPSLYLMDWKKREPRKSRDVSKVWLPGVALTRLRRRSSGFQSLSKRIAATFRLLLPRKQNLKVLSLEDLIQHSDNPVSLVKFLPEQLVKSSKRGREICSILFKARDSDFANPGGIELTHSAILGNIEAFSSTFASTDDDRLMIHLPLWHSSGRLGLLTALSKGCELQLSEGNALQSMQALSPTHAMAAPTVFIEMKNEIENGRMGPGAVSNIFLRVYVAIGSETARSVNYLTGQKAAFKPRQGNTLLDLLVEFVILLFSFPIKMIGDRLYGYTIRKKLGGTLRCVLTGGGAVPESLDLFFGMVGVSVLSAYWKTEASHVIASRILEFTGQRSRLQPGTVGPPLPGAEVKIMRSGEDVSSTPGAEGEIAIRGAFLFADEGRRDRSGWFLTGDRGCLSTDGELRLLNTDTSFQEALRVF